MLSSSMKVKLYCSFCLVEVIVRAPLHPDNDFSILAVQNLTQHTRFQSSLTAQCGGSPLQQGARSLSGIPWSLKVVYLCPSLS